MNTAMHALGIACQLTFVAAGAHAGWTMIATIRPRWRRILWLASGRIEQPTPPPQPRSLPPRHALPHPRAVEAGARATSEVR